MTAIVDIGTRTQVCNFKAQATNDPKLMREAIAVLGEALEQTEKLRPITRLEEDIARIERGSSQ